MSTLVHPWWEISDNRCNRCFRSLVGTSDAGTYLEENVNCNVKIELCKMWHPLYGACELPYRHLGTHSRVPGGSHQANLWSDEDARLAAGLEEKKYLTRSADPSSVDVDEKHKSILEEAGEIVSGPRRKAYGHPKPNHDRIALLWSAYLKAKYENEFDLDAIDVVLMMDAVKTARLIESPDHRDSWVDKVGYSACGAIIEGVDPA